MGCIYASFLLINLTPYPWSNAGGSGPPAPEVPLTSLNPVAFAPLAWNLCSDNGVYPQVSQSYYVGPGGNSTLTINAVPQGTGDSAYLAPSYTVKGLNLLGALSGTSITISKGSIITDASGTDYWAPVILAGDNAGPWTDSRPPVDWMQQSLEHLGCLLLTEMVIPGTHDSGMSVVDDMSNWDTTANSQTQYNPIGGQLISGARYFDIRPAVRNGAFVTSHWTAVDIFPIDSVVGGDGQPIASIVDDINAFTSTNKELIILDMSHFIDWDTTQGTTAGVFTNNDFLGLMQVLAGINSLYVDTSLPNFATATLDSFIGNGKAAVIVLFDDQWEQTLSDNGYLGHGFFIRSASLPMGGNYANTDDLDTMRQREYANLQTFSADPASANKLFVLSWTYTLQWGEEILNALDTSAFSIQDGAIPFNNHMTDPGPAGSPAWQKTWLAWQGTVGDRYPNIVIQDFLPTENNLAAMCLALTRLKAGDKCVPPPPSSHTTPGGGAPPSSPTPKSGSPGTPAHGTAAGTTVGHAPTSSVWHGWGGWGPSTTMVTSVVPTSSSSWGNW